MGPITAHWGPWGLDKLHAAKIIVKPWPQALAPSPKTFSPKNAVGHHHPPITSNHEGGVPQQNPKSKTYSEWSPLLVRQSSGGQQEEGHKVVHHVQ